MSSLGTDDSLGIACLILGTSAYVINGSLNIIHLSRNPQGASQSTFSEKDAKMRKTRPKRAQLETRKQNKVK